MLTWKRAGALLLALLMLCSCSREAAALSASQVAQAVLESQTDLPEMHSMNSESENMDATLERVYGVNPDLVSEAYVYYAGGTSASEIVVLDCVSAQAAKEASQALEAYAEGRQNVFIGYAPAEAELVSDRVVLADGDLAVLVICPDPQAAADAAGLLRAAVPERTTTPGPTETAAAESETGYNHDAVLTAVQSGNMDGLDDENRQVAKIVRNVIDNLISPDMSPYEKEVVVHDWMVDNIAYDPASMTHPLTGADPIANHENPIGALLAGYAICYGYSSTFQLFMDALGIPCITIDGAAEEEDNLHSWNMIELDGQWYYVDVTWDDPVGWFPRQLYLNQTAEFFKAHGPHIWDETGLPEAASQPYSGSGS